MSILAQLSSQVGDRSENSNRKVVLQCLDDPDLLDEIADSLQNKEVALVGDCAEVLTQVAEQHPDWVVPHAGALAALVGHKTTRVRWEAVHALALVATHVPAEIESLLPELAEAIRTDASVIVRDYAVDAIGNYALTGEAAAEKAYPLLKEALVVWNGKQAGHALKGLANVAEKVPALQGELRSIGEEYASSGRAVVRKAARELLKATGVPAKTAG
jgi:hypothetical protein